MKRRVNNNYGLGGYSLIAKKSARLVFSPAEVLLYIERSWKNTEVADFNRKFPSELLREP